MITTTRRRSPLPFPRAYSLQLSSRSLFRDRYPDLAIRNFKVPIQEAGPRSLDDASAPPVWKRGFDILSVVLFLPFLVVIAALAYCWIQIVSPGKVLFRQTRVGRNGKPFTIYKFRSMELQAPTDVHEAHVEHLIRSNKPMTKLDLAGDSRLIKGGCLIRSSGIDELPQLINMLRGEMSLVGPRPCLPNEFNLYGEHQRDRFSVQPGLTGQWQVHRTERTTFSEMVKMDDHYVDHLSPLTDFRIILQTPVALFAQMKGCGKAKAAGKRQGPASSAASTSQAFGLSMSVSQKLSD